MNDDRVEVVYCTCDDRAQAIALARGLVAERLAACVNVVPGLTSVYQWQGEVCEDSELLLIVKTTRETRPALQRWLEANHPYDVPEILALPVAGGAQPYLQWVFDETAANKQGD